MLSIVMAVRVLLERYIPALEASITAAETGSTFAVPLPQDRFDIPHYPDYLKLLWYEPCSRGDHHVSTCMASLLG